MDKNSRLLRVAGPCVAIILLAGCGGGSSGSSSSVTTYTVSATAGAGGSVSPATATVDAGGTTQFTVTPGGGYVVGGVTGCGGTLSGNTYTTGAINSNCSVTASFTAQYTVTATTAGGGTISPSTAAVTAGGTTTFTVAANAGYGVFGVTGCGGALSGSTYTTGTISADCTVTATFVRQASVRTEAAGGGTISPSSATVNLGGTTTFTVTPDSGYVFNYATGCGAAVSGNTLTAGPITGDCLVVVQFSPAFTWMGGSNTTGASGVYGIQGVPAAANVPGARDGGVTWTDANGNLWLFGGFAGYVHNSTSGDFLNDLWEYLPLTGEWTWMSGSNTIGAQGNYGTEGVAAATNVPGARSNEISWTDASGNLWLFGGGGTDSSGTFVTFNDIWKYSPSSGEWTWEGGSNATDVNAVYGTQGVAAAANTPGGRLMSDTVWKDAAGNVWLFGGYGYFGGTWGYTGDLWEYSPSSGEWTWVSGANALNASGVYGTQSVAAPANRPGARYIPVTWVDGSGNFWMFGGYGYDSAGAPGELNDLWEYSPASNEWTYVRGSMTANPAGVYGTQGLPEAANSPPPRSQAVGWMDANGNMWMFGGEGYDTSTGFYHRLNDLWEYSAGEWIWVAGSNTFDATGTYGTLTVAAAANVPGARAEPFKWQDGSGNVWLFGGFQYDDATGTRFEMNDLWKYPTQ